MQHHDFRGIPSVSCLLESPALQRVEASCGRHVLLALTRRRLEHIRTGIGQGKSVPPLDEIVDSIVATIGSMLEGSLRRVVNATGVLLHTNLGRAPLGRELLSAVQHAVEGYSNLEFRFESGERGRRMEHLSPLLRMATGAEDAIAVNNNAAAVLLVLRTFAEGRQVITSRGELIEIGGAFRMPDIIEAGGARLVEVGTTNRTRISDYERAIGDDSAVILKSHCSNYRITGFQEEVCLRDLAALARSRGLLLLHDIGSGLLGDSAEPTLQGEPSARQSLRDGADLVMFSCDKLLGGPQAGIIAGRQELIARVASEPLLRAVRLDKVAIALLHAVLLRHLTSDPRQLQLPLWELLQRTASQRQDVAGRLAGLLRQIGIECTVTPSDGCHGGGAMPGQTMRSYAVCLQPGGDAASTEQILRSLRLAVIPVIAIAKEGRPCLDVLAMFEHDIGDTVETIRSVLCDT